MQSNFQTHGHVSRSAELNRLARFVRGLLPLFFGILIIGIQLVFRGAAVDINHGSSSHTTGSTVIDAPPEPSIDLEGAHFWNFPEYFLNTFLWWIDFPKEFWHGLTLLSLYGESLCNRARPAIELQRALLQYGTSAPCS
jgi:hypothetical protein